MHDVVQQGGRRVTPVRLGRAGAIALIVAAVVVSGGCGGQSDPQKQVAALPATSAAAQPSSASSGDLFAYARCMRQNGVTNYPDPAANGALALPAGIDPNSSQFKAADGKCQQYRPSGSPNVQDGGDAQAWSSAGKLRYAQCMRTNGVPKFPDPDSKGGFVFMQGSGIDPQSASVKKAEAACAKFKAGGAPADPGANSGGGS